MATNNSKTHILTQATFICVIIILLQTMSSLLVKFGLFNISLVLVPIVVGGILMGPKYAALFGGIFGAIVTVFCIIGLDAGGFILFTANPLMCTLMCMTKGIVAGFVPAVIYKILYNSFNGKKRYIPILISAALTPVLNTGIFCGFMFLFFADVLKDWAGQTDILTYVITSLVGVNFIFEFILNIIVCPAVSSSLFKSRYVIKLIK